MVSATTNKPSAGTSLPTTRCMNCQTVFELPLELLDSADTRVRCGECLCIFDAREGLVPVDKVATAVEPEAKKTDEASNKRRRNKSNRSARARAAQRKKSQTDSDVQNDASALDVTYSDFDLFSEDADLPALAYLDETRETPEFDFDAVELGDEETFSDTLFAHDVTINADLPIPESEPHEESETDRQANSLSALQRTDVDFAVDKVPEEPLIFKYEDPPAKESQNDNSQETAESPSDESSSNERSKDSAESPLSLSGGLDENVAYVPVESEIALDVPKRRLRSIFVWLFGSLLLIGVLIATVVYPKWESLDQSTTFRPMKIALCKILNCQVSTRVDTGQLKVLRREVVESADLENALTISITLQNTADFAQRFPVVEVRMNNRVGRVVAQRAFKPTDYWSVWQRGDVLDAGQIIDISLMVSDPGTAANDFNLSLRELRLNCSPTTAPDGSERWPVDCAEP